MSAESFFTYPVTRRYPSKFTWIVPAGGAIVIALFTFYAVVANTYELESKYFDDYNATIADTTWYQGSAFSWRTNVKTTCQPALLSLGGDYTTTNQGFHYEIASFRHEGNESSIPLTASYKNGSLSECQVQEIVIELLRANPTRLPRNYFTWGSTIARSTTECLMETDDRPMRVNFTSRLPSIRHYNDISESFIGHDDSSHPGRYLGAQILAARYIQLSTAMGYSVPKSNESVDVHDLTGVSWASGSITLTRNNDVLDYTSLEFFHCAADFQENGRDLPHMTASHTIQDWKDQWTPENEAKNFQPQLPNISTVVDVFGKAYYSLSLSDFNSTDQIKVTNALSTGDGLKYLQNVSDTDLAEAKVHLGGKGDGKIDEIFDPATTNLSEPLINAQYTTLNARYLCSTPRPKSTSQIVFAVVLADLVFLGTYWTVFTWVATWWLGRKISNLEHCIGCVKAANDIPLALAPGSGGGGNYSQVYSDAEDELRASARKHSSPQVTRVHSGV